MTMRDFSCFRDAAVTTVSSSSAAAAADAHHLDRSLQAATSCVYRAALASSSKELLVTVTWTRSLANATVTDAAATPGATGLSLAVQDVLPLAAPKHLIPPSSATATPRRSSMPPLTPPTPQSQHKMQLQTKRRGSRSFVTEGGTAVAVHWDTSNAKYPSPSCPEPCGEYHLAVVADGELALLLGTGVGPDISRRFGTAPRPVLVSRREQLRAPPPATPTHSPTCAAVAHSTRCRFRDGGAEHEVTVRCRGDRRAASADEGEVAVSVDGRTVVEARRVGWNFRGNRTAVLPDGAIVEVMWDVHDWWFATTGTGAAQFMVKARGGGGGGGGGVWMDEEMASKGHPPAGFFLHMQCYRR
uniref:Uncharacterized protein n=1 Tax=Avena sativa TaxID=4498 RepID=A0ACD5XVI9_AVESA